MPYEHLLADHAEGIATLTLNRPEKLNAQTRFSLGELRDALLAADADDAIGVIVLRGAGRAFCAGKDLKTSFGAAGLAQLDGAGAQFTDVCDTIEAIGKPVIAAVQGHAVTGGCLLAYTADIVVAAENARFLDTHAKWGLLPGAGESQRLPRVVGLAKAREMLFTCEPMDAREAWQRGLVARVVPVGELDEAAREIARRILRNSRASIRALKALLNQGARADFATGMRQESELVRGGMANWQPDPDRDARLAAFGRT
jgi:enoyl-CoA hydratase/carnithine racemase